MKNDMKLLMIFLVLFLITGCTSSAPAGDKETAERSLPAQTPAEITEKTAAHDMRQGDTVILRAEGYEMDIPSAWQETDDGYYAENNGDAQALFYFRTADIGDMEIDEDFVKNNEKMTEAFFGDNTYEVKKDDILRTDSGLMRCITSAVQFPKFAGTVHWYWFAAEEKGKIGELVLIETDGCVYDHSADLKEIAMTVREQTERTLIPEEAAEPLISPEREMLDAAEVTFTTDTLEYSKKEIDPLTLIRCSDPEVAITAENGIDLTDWGEPQTVTYTLSIGEETRQVEHQFTVVDSRAPEIRLKSDAVDIAYGTDYDPASNVVSVSDPVDGDLKRVDDEKNVKIGTYCITGSLNTKKAGMYAFAVIACDSTTNITRKEFTVTVGPEPYQEPKFNYIANKNTKKFHYPECRSVSQMKEKNKKYFYDVTREDMIRKGYSPCGNCDP